MEQDIKPFFFLRAHSVFRHRRGSRILIESVRNNECEEFFVRYYNATAISLHTLSISHLQDEKELFRAGSEFICSFGIA